MSNVTPSDEELKRRRRRNSIALGLVLAALAIIFYVLTIVKMGPAVFNRDL
jgi:hypothetical protein